MPESKYSDLQRQHGGRYVAQRDGKVIAVAETYDELSRDLDQAGANWSELVIEYVEPIDIVCVY